MKGDLYKFALGDVLRIHSVLFIFLKGTEMDDFIRRLSQVFPKIPALMPVQCDRRFKVEFE